MRDDLKRRLEENADSQGRSLSEEIEFLAESMLLQEAAYGGKELNGLLKLMVGAAEIIQARTEKSWSSDWETSIAVRAAWKKLAAAAGPRPPAGLIQYELPPPPELPTRPSPPRSGLLPPELMGKLPPRRGLLTPELMGKLSHLIAHDSVEAKDYVAEMATIEKANRKDDRLRAKYVRQLEALRQDNQAWIDRLISLQDLGEDVAAELLPRREAVMQTAIPAQRVEKTKEK
jgi:hypothetical protein